MINTPKRWLDFQPGIFSLLGFEINSLIDNGESLPKDEVHKMCDDYSIIEWLSNKGFASMTSWDDETKIIMAEEFCALSNVSDDEGKFLIQNNGLCLLVAYCFEFIKNPPSRDRKDCEYAEQVLRRNGVIA